jgi:DNA-binding NarL/FixJ family response regulator
LAELRAAGGTSEITRTGTTDLTPQEVRIVHRDAMGKTNAEVAHALFLSTKTIENRLTMIYRKLGIRSRTQLAGLLDQLPASATRPSGESKQGETPLPASRRSY